ncbi:MAG TPA: DUF4142 domain-containing protein [Vicinamibacterales bacterium]|jgi:putative membrane protein|nr:DUF4142 domain-containing protein [Vicinamibacterales bacterium]
MKRMGLTSIVCAAAFAAACNGNARTTTNNSNNNEPASVGTAGTTADNSVHDAEKTFINNQLAAGMAEVELGKLASTHAASADVKQFGQMMVRDHTKAGDDLKKIASTWNVTPDARIDDHHQDVIDRLSKLRGSEFDKEYAKAMVDDHQEDLDDLQSRVDSQAPFKDQVTGKSDKDTNVTPERSDNAPKADVNAWAANTLPVVRQHLDQAKSLKDKIDNQRTSNTARNAAPRTGRTTPANH